MTDTTTGAPAAGWYADPAGSGALRWWSGVHWTDATRAPIPATPPAPAVPVPAPAVPVPAATIAVPAVPRAPEPARAAASPPSTDAYAPAGYRSAVPATALPVTGYATARPVTGYAAAPVSVSGSSVNSGPAVQAYSRDPAVARAASASMSTFAPTPFAVGSPNTTGVWLLALTPTMSLVVAIVVATIAAIPTMMAPTAAATDLQDQALRWAVNGIVLALSWVFAFMDRAALQRAGYPPPSLLWMLLIPPLAYLIARGRAVRKLGGRAWPPELVFFAQIALGVGVVALFVVWLMLAW